MPRPPKKAADDKSKVPAPAMVVPPVMGGGVPTASTNPLGAPRVVDNDSFLRVRDSVS